MLRRGISSLITFMTVMAITKALKYVNLNAKRKVPRLHRTGRSILSPFKSVHKRAIMYLVSLSLMVGLFY